MNMMRMKIKDKTQIIKMMKSNLKMKTKITPIAIIIIIIIND